MSFNVGQAVGYLDLDTSGFNRGFKSALQDLKIFQDQSASVMGKVGAIGSAMTNVGSSMTKYVTTPIVSLGAASMAVGTKFESAMSRVQAISGATGKELEALTDQALDLGASTAFSASEVASGMENLASAGFTVEEIMGAMPGLLDLAASSGADLATSSEIAASAIRGFGLEAASAGHVADVFAEAAARTNAQTEDMGEAMKYVAPVAAAMGQSIEETAAAIGIMSDAGIKGSQAGTALRGAFSRLSKPTDAMVSVMKRLGLSFYDTYGNMLPLNGIIRELEEGTAGLTQEQRNQDIVTLFGQNALSGVLALMGRGSDDLIELTESFENVDGAAAEMAETMMDNTKGSLEEMMGALETLAIIVSQILAPVIRDIADWLSELINKFNSLDEETQQTIVGLLGVAAAIGPILLVSGKALSSISQLSSAFSYLKTVFSSTGSSASPIVSALAAIPAPAWIVIAIVAVLAAAFATLWKTQEEFKTKITSIWFEIQTMFNDTFSQITESINSLGFNFENFGEVLKALWMGLSELLGPILIGAFQGLSDTIKFTLDTILATVNFFVSVFKGDWEGAWDAIKDFFIAHWDFIVDFFDNVGEILLGMLDAICGWFGTTWEDTWDSIKEFFTDTWNSIVTFFKTLPEKIGYILGLMLGHVARWIVDTASEAKEVGPQIIQRIVNFFAQLPSKIQEKTVQAFNRIKQWGTDIKTWITGTLPGIISDIIERFKELPERLPQIGKDLVTGLWNGITGASSWLLDKITGFADGIIQGFKDAFGIASPAKSTRILGRFLPQGLALGVDDTADEAVDSIDAMSDSMLARAERMVKSVGGLFRDTNTLMSSGILQSDYLRGSTYASGTQLGSSRSIQGTRSSTPSPMGGNVFNFYSPKAIDPVQAASLMRKTSQELALEV